MNSSPAPPGRLARDLPLTSVDGAAISTHLAEAGADVALTYVQAKERAEGVVAGIEARGRRGVALLADDADADAVVAAVDQAAGELGRLDILVNNAGIFAYGPLADVTGEEVDTTLAVHVRAVFVAAQAASRHMGEGGRIITIVGMALLDESASPLRLACLAAIVIGVAGLRALDA